MRGIVDALAGALGRLWLLGALLALYAAFVFWTTGLQRGEGGIISPASGAILGAICVVIALNLARDRHKADRDGGGDAHEDPDMSEAIIGISLIVSAATLFFVALAGWLGGLAVACALSGLVFWICRDNLGMGIWARLGVAAMPILACGAAIWAIEIFGAAQPV